MNSSQVSEVKNLETDIVVIGGGGAGLCAALAAAENGAGVILLEKKRKPGGNSAMAEGLFGAESPAQKRSNIDAQRDELFKTAMDYAHLRVDAKIVRAFVDKSGDTIRWLEDKGITFHFPSMFPNQAPLVWHVPTKGSGAGMIKMLAKNSENLGVRILCETVAQEILTDDKKRVTGVLAKTKDGEIKITAKCAVITTGGYGGNKELLKKYYPFYSDNMHCVGFPNMGDGLMMAIKAGAATDGLGILHFSSILVPGEPRSLNLVAEEPNVIWVNKKGERFTDEAIVFGRYRSVNAVIRQPDSICYTIFDESIKKYWEEKGYFKAHGIFLPPGTKTTDLEKVLSSAKEDNVKKADSWDEIAGWMGSTSEALKNTINEYNSYCDKKHDDIFVKDNRYLFALRTPPYYAVRCCPRFLTTIGGIKINHRMEVLDKEADRIPGLYAAGVDAGGWESESYCALLSGSGLGFAYNSGRIAGENAAKYASKK